MVGREKKLVRHLSEEKVEQLLTETDDIEVYKRLVILKLLYGGATLAEAATDVGVSEGTASNWVECWNEDGLGKLTPNFGGGRSPKLDQSQREQLIERLREGQPRKKQEIQHLLDEELDVEFRTISQRSTTTLAYITPFLGRNALIDQTTPKKSSTNASSTRSTRRPTTTHTTSEKMTMMMKTGTLITMSVLMAGLSSGFSTFRIPNHGIILS